LSAAAFWERHKVRALEGFVAVNLAFLVLDIHLAHSVNRFRHWGEWIPFWFSAAAAPFIAYTCLAAGRGRRAWSFALPGAVVGALAIAVGVWGLVFHLESQFFERRTLVSLVYTAPFAAPLAFAGLGLLLLLDRQVEPSSPAWGAWVTILALGGFVGNFALSLADHAQNGFFHVTEWIPVAASAFAIGFLAVAFTARGREPRFLKVCLGVMAAQAAVGVLGFVLHLRADVNGFSSSAFENLVHGAPVLAPLLFANLALLGACGVWDALLHARAASPARTTKGRDR
jgi:hypothetical protein